MAQIPSGTKFLGVDPSVPTSPERNGRRINDKSEHYTVDDIAAFAGVGSIGPQGVEGPAGPPGPVGPAGLEWQGAWDTDSQYAVNDAVGFNGASYFCILEITGTGNDNPEANNVNWALLASQGADGAQGAQGPTGPQGAQGVQGIQGIQGPEGVASQTLQETVDLGNTVEDILQGQTITLSGRGISVNDNVEQSDTIFGAGFIKKQIGSNSQWLLMPSSITGGSKFIQLPNSGGTIALTTDIPFIGYKTYRALLNQTGSNAPVATVLENDFTGSIVWTRALSGAYVGTLTGQFLSNKTFITNGFVELNPTGNKIYVSRSSNDTIEVISSTPSFYEDGILVNFPLEVIVYD
jgi:hypothetical protein